MKIEQLEAEIKHLNEVVNEIYKRTSVWESVDLPTCSPSNASRMITMREIKSRIDALASQLGLRFAWQAAVPERTVLVEK